MVTLDDNDSTTLCQLIMWFSFPTISLWCQLSLSLTVSPVLKMLWDCLCFWVQLLEFWCSLPAATASCPWFPWHFLLERWAYCLPNAFYIYWYTLVISDNDLCENMKVVIRLQQLRSLRISWKRQYMIVCYLAKGWVFVRVGHLQKQSTRVFGFWCLNLNVLQLLHELWNFQRST